MVGEFNGLQAKIMRENSSTLVYHCFAHKLNLLVVAVYKILRMSIIIGQLFGEEIKHTFNEVNNEFLRCMAAFIPSDLIIMMIKS